MLQSLLSQLPLASVNFTSEDAISLTEKILDTSGGIVDTIADIGIGIGSLFLLFVIFVYVSNILDGGKFQVKMLIPLLIYICVCNFKIVAGPVISFATTIQKQCHNACVNQIHTSFTSIDGDADRSILNAFWAKANETTDPITEQELLDGMSEDAMGYDKESTGSDESSSSHFTFKGIANNIYNALSTFFKNVKIKVFESLLTDAKYLGRIISYGLSGLIAQLLQWACELVSIAINAMGAVLTGIVVVFGPITWAFAIFPGNSKTIGAWAIRICQFSLYSPICALIESFFISLTLEFLNATLSWGTGAGPLLMMMGLMVGLIACMMSVPAIASMIIEGAQGAITLSQGLQTASSISQIFEARRDRNMQNAIERSGGGGPMSGSGGGGSTPSSSGGGAGGGLTGGTR